MKRFNTWGGCVAVGLIAASMAACGTSSPTEPAPERSGTTVVMNQQDTVIVPGTDLRLTSRGVAWPGAIDCIANAPCNLTPSPFIEAKVPDAPAASLSLRLPNPEGGDTAAYGAYIVRVTGTQPAWDPQSGISWERYRLVIRVTRR